MPALSTKFSRRLLQLLCGAILVTAASPAFAIKINKEDITGNLPRGTTGLSSFTLKFIIREISKANIAASETSGQTSKDWFSIAIQNDSKLVQKTSECAVADGSPFYIEFNKDPPVSDPNDQFPDQFDYTYDLTIRECAGQSTALEDLLAGQTSLLITVKPQVGGEGPDNGTDTTLAKALYIVSDTPTFSTPPATGSDSVVFAYWNVPAGKLKTRSATDGTVGTEVAPTKMNLVAIRADAAPATLPSKTFDPAQASDPVATEPCSFTPQTGDCVSCPDANTYVDFSKISGATTADVSKGLGPISGLENSVEYFVFMQYEPGSPASACVPAEPSPNFSLTELNGEGGARVESVRCFIASAAYGTPLDARLTLFRHFRDEVLMHTWLGRAFVDTYYTVSPPLADFISERPWLRAVARGFLEIPATILGYWEEGREN